MSKQNRILRNLSNGSIYRIAKAGHEAIEAGRTPTRKLYKIGYPSVLGGYALLHPDGVFRYSVAGHCMWTDPHIAEEIRQRYSSTRASGGYRLKVLDATYEYSLWRKSWRWF